MAKSNTNPQSSSPTGSGADQPNKVDYKVADYLKSKLPPKQAMFVGIKKVNYFIGSRAVDLLMSSPWSKDGTFTTRESVVTFLNGLLAKKFFHRARTIIYVRGSQEQKKFKLDMHDDQKFVDSREPFVWLYEPISLKAWAMCLLIVFGVIAVCLFPLWPPMVRLGVYYLCIGGLVLLSSILALAVLRQIVFVLIWLLTFGKIHFWLFPNLTEDVGFFESFWPIYTTSTAGSSSDNCLSTPTDYQALNNKVK